MCTVVCLNGAQFFFGRNMDIEGSFGEEIVLTPRRFPLHFRRMPKMDVHYAMLGVAAVLDGYPLYADAMNEHGLCIAGLNFVGNAHYFSPESCGMRSLAPYELIPWILATCKNCMEARSALDGMQLAEISFRADVPLSDLHWILADGKTCLVVESTETGLHLYENPLQVLANNPPLPSQIENWRQYARLTPEDTNAEPFFSLGLGAVGLPGDYSSVSRFVRASYLRESVLRYGQADLSAVYQILDAVAPPKGSVLDCNGHPHYTTYSCCMDAARRAYTYTTHENRRITAVAMEDSALSRGDLYRIPLRKEQSILWESSSL